MEGGPRNLRNVPRSAERAECPRNLHAKCAAEGRGRPRKAAEGRGRSRKVGVIQSAQQGTIPGSKSSRTAAMCLHGATARFVMCSSSGCVLYGLCACPLCVIIAHSIIINAMCAKSYTHAGRCIYVYVYRRWVHGTRGAGAEGRGTTRGMGRGGGGGATAEYAGGYGGRASGCRQIRVAASAAQSGCIVACIRGIMG